MGNAGRSSSAASAFGSFAHRLLMVVFSWCNYPLLSAAWLACFAWCQRRVRKPISVRIHGYRAQIPFGYTYLLTSRRYPTFNNPLVEIVYQSYTEKAEPISIIDVGAALGDTPMLLYANCPGMIKQCLCVDGDDEFFPLLERNIRQFPGAVSWRALLSDSHEAVRELVRIHLGTASAVGTSTRVPVTLDDVVRESGFESVDVLKIDVDGFDGRVLGGAKEVLTRRRPAVIFEWHPMLYRNAGNDWEAPFRLLWAAGYDRFVWYDKFGAFSHFTAGGLDAQRMTALLAQYCEQSGNDDWHFDVVALHADSKIDALRAAHLHFAKHRLSQY